MTAHVVKRRKCVQQLRNAPPDHLGLKRGMSEEHIEGEQHSVSQNA